MQSTLPKSARRTTLPHVKKIYTEGRTVPRRRNDISPSATGLPERFALHLRDLMERRGWSSKQVAELVTEAGLPLGDRAVDSWLRGESMPKAKDLETIGVALGLADYRDLLPKPLKRR